MQVQMTHSHGMALAVVQVEPAAIASAQAALDLMATIHYEHDCNRVALNKEALAEEFFRLGSGLAGEVLQKFVNYRFKLAVYGDFSRYASKPLQDFIRESNRGSHVFFVSTLEEAVEKLGMAR